MHLIHIFLFTEVQVIAAMSSPVSYEPTPILSNNNDFHRLWTLHIHIWPVLL